MVALQTSNLEDRVRISGAAHWLVGVMVNIADCRSVDTSSILVLTAEKMLCGVTVSISVFDTDGIGSNPIATTNGGCSLFGKVPHCE